MRNLTGRQLAFVAATVLVLSMLVAGVYGLVRGRGGPPSESVAQDSHPIAANRETAEVATTLEDRALPHTTDAVVYARAIAIVLFDWDTAVGLLPSDYTAPVLADADPSGEETPGLITDVAAYLPTVEQWLDLGSMQVIQTLVVADAYVPASWPNAIEQARGHLRPGTTAVTIIGTRHRSGVWNGEPAKSSHPVAFTVFVACPPAFDRCRVLRLSQLDNALR